MPNDVEQPKKGQNIKRLLRHRTTGEYYKEDGWTKNRLEAKCFVDVVEVAEVCARRGLIDVELALCTNGSEGAELFCTHFR